MTRSRFHAALALLLGLALPLSAQTHANVGVLGGYYRPFGHFDPASIYSTALPNEPADLSGALWGGVGQVTIRQRFGVQAQLAVARSTLPGGWAPIGLLGPTKAEVDIAVVEGQYDLSPRPERYRVWLSAGPALIRHTGDAYAQYGNPVSVGGAAGLAFVVPLRDRLQLATDLTTLWYVMDVAMPPDLRANPGSLEHGAQRDAMLHVGLRWGRL